MTAHLLQQEQTDFLTHHHQSLVLSQSAGQHFLFGLPLHWMRDWPLPAPSSLFVRRARGIKLECVDGLTYRDFCLGDTGAMFGHSPPPVAAAIARQAAQGLTYMLPAANTARVGGLLRDTFGLDKWQLTLSASDANRFVLRWARAISQRRRIVVFDGCYHGAVDDTLVDYEDGRTLPRASLLGGVHNHADFTVVVPFNDLDALEGALASGDIAALLAEPALTNCGLVPPIPGFWESASALCQRYGVLLIMDETHTISSGHGGYCRSAGLSPDFVVIGKAVAGGLPCAVYGFSAAIATRMAAAKAAAPEGHSGIGTTLSGNALALAALEATLAEVNTPVHYGVMLTQASRLEAGLKEAIARHNRAWTVTRIGARMELQFMPHTPRDAAEVRQHSQPTLETLLHLYMLNRGFLLTPFHAMLLVSPATGADDVNALVKAFEGFAALNLD